MHHPLLDSKGPGLSTYELYKHLWRTSACEAIIEMEEDHFYDLITSLNFSASQWKFTGSSRQSFTNKLVEDGFSSLVDVMPTGPYGKDHTWSTSQAVLSWRKNWATVLTSLIRFMNLGPRRHGLWRWHCRELTVSWAARWEAMATIYTASYIRAASVCGGKHTQFQFHLYLPSFACVITLPASLSLICLISTDIYSPAERFSFSCSYFSLK